MGHKTKNIGGFLCYHIAGVFITTLATALAIASPVLLAIFIGALFLGVLPNRLDIDGRVLACVFLPLLPLLILAAVVSIGSMIPDWKHDWEKWNSEKPE